MSTFICLFLNFRKAPSTYREQPSAIVERVASLASMAPGLVGASMHLPSDADDPYLKDTDVPGLVLQLYFDGVEALRQQCLEGSALEGMLADMLAASNETPASSGLASGTAKGLAGGRADGLASGVAWQAMAVERIGLAAASPLPAVHCTYLVAYDGTSPDEAAWHAHYAEHHVPLMKRLPGLKQLEIYRPLVIDIDAPALRSFARSAAMQRNKVVFDSPQALTAALNSPIRHEMREDHRQSPPFEGRSTHYPMATRSWP